jgi:hypothetical protein
MNNFFKKDNTVYYETDTVMATGRLLSLLNNKKEWFDLWADYPAIKTSSWYKNMPLNISKEAIRKNKARYYIDCYLAGMEKKYTDARSTTIKLCPNIRAFLTNTMVIKAPCDFDVALDESTAISKIGVPSYVTVASDDIIAPMSPHDPRQFSNDDMFKGYMNYKISTHLILKAPKHISFTFSEPFYHTTKTKYKVVPGTFIYPHNASASIIFNILIDPSVKEMSFKKGDPLFYITFSEKVNIAEGSGKVYLPFKDKFLKGRGPII